VVLEDEASDAGDLAELAPGKCGAVDAVKGVTREVVAREEVRREMGGEVERTFGEQLEAVVVVAGGERRRLAPAEAQGEQRGDAGVDELALEGEDEHAAAPALSPVGIAEFDEGFTSPRQGAESLLGLEDGGGSEHLGLAGDPAPVSHLFERPADGAGERFRD